MIENEFHKKWELNKQPPYLFYSNRMKTIDFLVSRTFCDGGVNRRQGTEAYCIRWTASTGGGDRSPSATAGSLLRNKCRQ